MYQTFSSLNHSILKRIPKILQLCNIQVSNMYKSYVMCCYLPTPAQISWRFIKSSSKSAKIGVVSLTGDHRQRGCILRDNAINFRVQILLDSLHETLLEHAAKHAYAHDFISSLPDGYKMIVDDDLLSRGQKKRNTIARALLRNPSILILAKAINALNAESEYNIKMVYLVLEITLRGLSLKVNIVGGVDFSSLAIESKFMKRWEFDSIAQAAKGLMSWFPGTLYEALLLEHHLNYMIDTVGDLDSQKVNMPEVKNESGQWHDYVCRDLGVRMENLLEVQKETDISEYVVGSKRLLRIGRKREDSEEEKARSSSRRSISRRRLIESIMSIAEDDLSTHCKWGDRVAIVRIYKAILGLIQGYERVDEEKYKRNTEAVNVCSIKWSPDGSLFGVGYQASGTYVLMTYNGCTKSLGLGHIITWAFWLNLSITGHGGRNGPQGLEEPMSDEVLREMYDKNYHQLLPLIAEKMQKEKEQKDKLNAVKARMIYGEESGIKSRILEAHHHTPVFSKGLRSADPLYRGSGHRKKEACLIGWEERSQLPPHVLIVVNGVPKQKELRRQRSNTYEDDLSQPWTCEERNPFTPRIRHFSLPRTRMPSHVKTYDGSGDPEDHLKLFQSAAKTEGWAMPTWCHMFNSTLTGNARVWFDKLPKESINNYEDLRTAFRENYLQQTKHIKDPVEIHHIKQRDGESTEDFMERYKAEVLDVEGASECMRIFRFVHRITHPGLIKRLYERIPRSVDEMYRITTSFLQGEVAALSHGRRKASSSWKPSEGGGGQTEFQESLQK
ncbi:reverse transcriptase domain-containing protein [Tanacetum coccineum]